MSTFTYYLGKSFKKFTNFFYKNGANPFEISQDLNLQGSNFSNTNNSMMENPKLTNKSNLTDSTMEDSKNINTPIDENKRESLSGFIKKYVSKNRALKTSQLEERILRANILKNRVCQMVHAANNPIEDRHNAIQLKNFEGYFLSIFDGHGGYNVAEFANSQLHRKFDQNFLRIRNSENKMTEQEMVIASINYAYDEIVTNFNDLGKINF